MNSPLGAWLGSQCLRQGTLALRAGVDRTDICRSVRGQRKTPRKLREYLERHAPDVLVQHEAFIEQEAAA